MRLGWSSRQTLALIGLAVVLACTSGLFEILNVLRLSTDRAKTEAGFVTDAIERLIISLHGENPQADLVTLARDSQLAEILGSGLAHPPSLEGIVVCDPQGIAVAHAIPDMVGQPVPDLPNLPRLDGFADAMRLLGRLRERQNFQVSSELMQGDQPFVSIRAQISGTLLWDEVQRVLRRGLLTGAVVLFLALGLGILLGRAARGRVRILEEGIAAIREGSSDPIPEEKVAMFGQVARELNILRDRVQMEPRILASVDQLAAGMAHEIHQPIQAIRFALDALRNPRQLPPEELESQIDTATTAIERMHRSVEGFLRVVRIKPMQVETVSLNPLLEEVQSTLETAANLAGLELELALDRDLPETYADAQVLRQAIENLVKNAIQALPSREGRVIIRSRFAEDAILLSVEDSGPGIPDDLRPKIFNFYFTTKESGTGVGLALVRRAAEIHGGEVEIDSESGRGTTMTLRFPLRAASARRSRKGTRKVDPGVQADPVPSLPEPTGTRTGGDGSTTPREPVRTTVGMPTAPRPEGAGGTGSRASRVAGMGGGR